MSEATRSSKPRRKKRGRNLILTRAEKDPELALERGWYEDPVFCEGFLNRCENQSLFIEPTALDMAMKGLLIAETNGNPHLINSAHGVLVHAFVARREYRFGRRMLARYRDRALSCCRPCRSEYFRREGDLLSEMRKPEQALKTLNRCVEEGGRYLVGDALGRVCYVRGDAFHHAGYRRRALDDAGCSLQELSTDSPRGLFLDSIALLAVYLRGGGLADDKVALEHLKRFKERIVGVRHWQDVRTRVRWTEAHIEARLGNVHRAQQLMKCALDDLLVSGLTREAVNGTLDFGQLKCRSSEPLDREVEDTLKAIETCLAKRADLTEENRRQLVEIKDTVLPRFPEDAVTVLRRVRKSFVSPVPPRLAERIGEREYSW